MSCFLVSSNILIYNMFSTNLTGCHMRKLKHIARAGSVYGRLTITDCPSYCPSAELVTCLCECGNKKSVPFGNLIQGLVKSCGCLRKESIANVGRTINKKHGMALTDVYHIWSSMKARCLNKNSISFPNYGGRGIKVCKEWELSFEAFYRDMGPRPSKNHEIDRIDPNGNYDPNNCRWIDGISQQNNRRNNKEITFQGRTMTIAEWAREKGWGRMKLWQRLKKGWSVEKALLTP